MDDFGLLYMLQFNFVQFWLYLCHDLDLFGFNDIVTLTFATMLYMILFLLGFCYFNFSRKTVVVVVVVVVLF